MTNPSASPTPAASGTAAGGANPVADALQLVLATEHAAVYGYPMMGVRLSDSAQVQRARDLEAAHRQLRDEVTAQLARLAVAPVAAQPTYPQAGAASSSSSSTAPAIRSAVAIEEQCASAYRYLLTAAVSAGDGEQQVRIQAMTGLATAAANATAWRSLVVPAKPTVALPGL